MTTHDTHNKQNPDIYFGNFCASRGVWPSGQPHLSISHREKHLGFCMEVEGGYLVLGKRKPVASLAAVAQQLIRDQLRAAEKVSAPCEQMLRELSDVDAR